MIKSWWQQREFAKQLKAFRNSPLVYDYVPFVDTGRCFDETDFLVLDFETTGLNPKKGRLLSVGFTTISGGRVKVGQSAHYFIRHRKMIPDETVAIHHITEQEAAQGQPIQAIFPEILQQLSEKVLVAHFADIEVGFLQQIARTLYQTKLPLVVVDTLQLAHHLKYRHAVHIPQQALNLSHLRQDYGLLHYKAHNAMIDAVATAELLLVLVEEFKVQSKQSHIELKSLLLR